MPPCRRSLRWPRPSRTDYSSRRASRGCARSGRGAAGAAAVPRPAAAAAPTPVPGFTRGLLRLLGMARPLVPSSQKALLLELKGLQEEPVEGFRVNLVDEGDLYNWEVAIFGPPNTYYEGGYFKVNGKGRAGVRGVWWEMGLRRAGMQLGDARGGEALGRDFGRGRDPGRGLGDVVEVDRGDSDRVALGLGVMGPGRAGSWLLPNQAKIPLVRRGIWPHQGLCLLLPLLCPWSGCRRAGSGALVFPLQEGIGGLATKPERRDKRFPCADA